MKKVIVVLSFVILIAGIGIFISIWSRSNKQSPVVENSPLVHANITVNRSETCGCCKLYIEYLKRNGLTVTENIVEDIEEVKHDLAIPHELWSCHTSTFDNYIVEGHIPIEVIKKMYTETPDARGIALANMPAGSPGMGGFKQGSFEIHTLLKDEHKLWVNY